MGRFPAILVLVLGLAGVSAAETGGVARVTDSKPQPALVCTSCLATNLETENLRIVDARTSFGAYLKSHIPGAVYLNIESLRLSSGGIPGQLLPPDRLAYVFSEIGIGDSTPVVAYSSTDDHLANSTYVAMALEAAGHKVYAVLDGGFEQWEREALPVTAEIRPVKRTKFRAKKTGLVVARADVESLGKRQAEAVLVDAQPAASFAERHIPGARSLPAASFGATPESPLWLKPDAIDAIVKQAGLTTSTAVATYCGSGRDASKAWFTLKHVLKLPDVKVYDGSLADWSAAGLPTETDRTATTATTAH